MKIPYMDLRIQDQSLKSQLMQAFGTVLDHGRFIQGPEHDLLEQKIAKFCEKHHAVGVGSGSDALYLAFRALGIGPGDEVITTALSWVASANAIVLTGAVPVFVDITDDLNMDVALIEDAVTPRTKAILPVHFTGQMCDMEGVMEIAKHHSLPVVEDAAQAFGARCKERTAGSFGVMGCFSMNPMKLFNAAGEAGAIVTDDDGMAEKLRSLRYAGTKDKNDCVDPSINGRLDTMQAAMLLIMLGRLEGKIQSRRQNAKRYTAALGNMVVCPREKPGFRHTYYAYTLQAERRDALRDFLAKEGIETQIQHPIPIPHQSAYRKTETPTIPVAERLVQRILSLPIHEDMTDNQIESVIAAVKAFYRG